jgi:thymidine kinase
MIRRVDCWDILFLISLLASLSIYAALQVNFSARPFEDAAILMRYSQHVAEGHGIVWNVGGED